MLNAEEKIMSARVVLQKEKPFFAFLLLHAKVREFGEGNNIQGNTLAADAAGNIYFNSKYVNGLSKHVTKAAVCHEILHIALEHLYRSEVMKHNPKLGNIAADMVVNDILESDGFTLGDDWIVPRNHSFTLRYMDGTEHTVNDIDKKSVEEIYDEIYRAAPKGYNGGSGVPGGKNEDDSESGEGVPIDSDNIGQFDKHIIINRADMSDVEKKAAKEWKRKLTEAATYAKMRGELPAGMEERIGHILESRIGWKQQLHKYLTNMIPADYTYSHPSKKSISTGYYMPYVKKDDKLNIVVAIDTSGSIDQNDLAMFLGEMVGIARGFPQIEMRILDCDSEIQNDRVVKNKSDLRDITIKGRGGTSHIPVYDYISKKHPQTKLLINFTDGYTDFPEQRTWKWDTIWVITKGGCKPSDIPFGRVIKQE